MSGEEMASSWTVVLQQPSEVILGTILHTTSLYIVLLVLELPVCPPTVFLVKRLLPSKQLILDCNSRVFSCIMLRDIRV